MNTEMNILFISVNEIGYLLCCSTDLIVYNQLFKSWLKVHEGNLENREEGPELSAV